MQPCSVPGGQAFPQAPQLFSSTFVSVQPLGQEVSPAAHPEPPELEPLLVELAPEDELPLELLEACELELPEVEAALVELLPAVEPLEVPPDAVLVELLLEEPLAGSGTPVPFALQAPPSPQGKRSTAPAGL